MYNKQGKKAAVIHLYDKHKEITESYYNSYASIKIFIAFFIIFCILFSIYYYKHSKRKNNIDFKQEMIGNQRTEKNKKNINNSEEESDEKVKMLSQNK